MHDGLIDGLSLDGLSRIAPGLRDNAAVEGRAAADTYLAALDLADAASDTLDGAERAHSAAVDQLIRLRREFEKRSKALAELKRENADALRKAERAADRHATQVDFDPGGAVKGLRPHPKAVKAVRYALAQVGKQYRWGDEGPDRFDCSGLVWAAYRHAGVKLGARTARQQYYATRVVKPGHMLPGDLVFFGKNKSDPESIHHVGIYMGKGKIVHAPTAGDVVKVSPIWWWEFFAATRVVPAVKAPGKGKTEPGTKPKPKPSSGPSGPPSPRPSGSPSSPPSSSPPSSEPSPSPSTSPRPSPSQSPSPSGSPNPLPTGLPTGG